MTSLILVFPWKRKMTRYWQTRCYRLSVCLKTSETARITVSESKVIRLPAHLQYVYEMNFISIKLHSDMHCIGNTNTKLVVSILIQNGFLRASLLLCLPSSSCSSFFLTKANILLVALLPPSVWYIMFDWYSLRCLSFGNLLCPLHAPYAATWKTLGIFLASENASGSENITLLGTCEVHIWNAKSRLKYNAAKYLEILRGSWRQEAPGIALPFLVANFWSLKMRGNMVGLGPQLALVEKIQYFMNSFFGHSGAMSQWMAYSLTMYYTSCVCEKPSVRFLIWTLD